MSNTQELFNNTPCFLALNQVNNHEKIPILPKVYWEVGARGLGASDKIWTVTPRLPRL